MIEGKYYEQIGDKFICLLCPNHCHLKEGQTGRCHGRSAMSGKMALNNYGCIVAENIDPIEKKPLYHFFPGQSIYSIGTFGCNLKCIFCQNSDLSQQPSVGKLTSPDFLINHAKSITNNIGVAFTYNEPGVWFEYILDCAPLLRNANLKTVLATNGYLEPTPWEELCQHVDAMNIDLKSFSSDFYTKNCGGQIETVKHNIIQAFKKGIHIEITHLVVTTLNDNKDEFSSLVDWIAELSSDIPLHISRYFPRYLMTASLTPAKTMTEFAEIASKKIKYVYSGNIAGEQNTRCFNCGIILIERNGYQTVVRCQGHTCSCGTPLPFLA